MSAEIERGRRNGGEVRRRRGHGRLRCAGVHRKITQSAPSTLHSPCRDGSGNCSVMPSRCASASTTGVVVRRPATRGELLRNRRCGERRRSTSAGCGARARSSSGSARPPRTGAAFGFESTGPRSRRRESRAVSRAADSCGRCRLMRPRGDRWPRSRVRRPGGASSTPFGRPYARARARLRPWLRHRGGRGRRSGRPHLIREFWEWLDTRSARAAPAAWDGARPYGHGITYQPR